VLVHRLGAAVQFAGPPLVLVLGGAAGGGEEEHPVAAGERHGADGHPLRLQPLQRRPAGVGGHVEYVVVASRRGDEVRLRLALRPALDLGGVRGGLRLPAEGDGVASRRGTADAYARAAVSGRVRGRREGEARRGGGKQEPSTGAGGFGLCDGAPGPRRPRPGAAPCEVPQPPAEPALAFHLPPHSATSATTTVDSPRVRSGERPPGRIPGSQLTGRHTGAVGPSAGPGRCGPSYGARTHTRMPHPAGSPGAESRRTRLA
jgi:hypothetical protein